MFLLRSYKNSNNTKPDGSSGGTGTGTATGCTSRHPLMQRDMEQIRWLEPTFRNFPEAIYGVS